MEHITEMATVHQVFVDLALQDFERQRFLGYRVLAHRGLARRGLAHRGLVHQGLTGGQIFAHRGLTKVHRWGRGVVHRVGGLLIQALHGQAHEQLGEDFWLTVLVQLCSTLGDTDKRHEVV